MEKGKQPTTIFIHNLQEKMQWKGLWATFAHYGEVIDVFKLRKRSRIGKRFGFVRYSSRVDVDGAISRLNGFRISVSYAKFKIRTSYWRKVNHGNHEASESTGNTQKLQINNNILLSRG
ncbi:hypothetical protein V6N13_093187 [Hibiscus sabdariffa]